MKILIDGVGMTNKGAELMLISILCQIEDKYPYAKVIINSKTSKINIPILKRYTNLRISESKFRDIMNLCIRFRIYGLIRRLNSKWLVYFTHKFPQKGIDLIIDAGGFQIGDQWKHRDLEVLQWEFYLSRMTKYNTKIAFLPQAFGPLEEKNSGKIVDLLSKYSDLVFARELISYNYLLNSGMNTTKLRLSPDFTALTKGITLQKYSNLKEGICFIPNIQIIRKGEIHKYDYIQLFTKMIDESRLLGYSPFILNHEGNDDHTLCLAIKNNLPYTIPYVSNLDALEVKGIISQSHLVVSSRFHGVVSGLNSGAPCLATSWNHKYEMLYRDYDLSADFIVSPLDIPLAVNKLTSLLDSTNYKVIVDKLTIKNKEIIKRNHSMWDEVWNLIS